MKYSEIVSKIEEKREAISKLFDEIESVKTNALEVIATEIGSLKFRIQCLKDHKKEIKKA